MRHWIQISAAGRILSRGRSPHALDAAAVAHIPGAVIVETDVSSATHYRDGEFLTQPDSPGAGYVFADDAFAWVFDPAVASSAARARRARLLAASDWTQLPDAPAASKTAWTAYRQALRDITDQPGFPENTLWPTAPDQ